MLLCVRFNFVKLFISIYILFVNISEHKNNLFQDCEKVTYQHCQRHRVHRWLVAVLVKHAGLVLFELKLFLVDNFL